MTKALTDEQLHAYVDNALTDDERREVDAWIAQDAAAAQKVRSYLEQNLALHALFDPVLAEPPAATLPAGGGEAGAAFVALVKAIAAGPSHGSIIAAWYS